MFIGDTHPPESVVKLDKLIMKIYIWRNTNISTTHPHTHTYTAKKRENKKR
jgi:hypothetical protein